MKKVIVVLAMVFFGLSVFADGDETKKTNKVKTQDFVITLSDTLFADQVNEGMLNLSFEDAQGKTKVAYQNVRVYKSGDDFYARIPAPNSNKEVFARIVSQKWNLRLYEVVINNGTFLNNNGKAAAGEKMLMVYENDRFVTELNEKNYEHLAEVFRIN